MVKFQTGSQHNGHLFVKRWKSKIEKFHKKKKKRPFVRLLARGHFVERRFADFLVDFCFSFLYVFRWFETFFNLKTS